MEWCERGAECVRLGRCGGECEVAWVCGGLSVSGVWWGV